MITAFILIIVAGVLSGIFSLPVTRVKDWEFEHIWSMGSLFALVILPWPLVLLFVPDISDVYSSIPVSTILAVIFCGAAWGIGGIFWGRAIDALGMALGVSLMMSLINIFGSIGPISIFEPQLLSTPGGKMLIVALLVLIAGVVIIALAGKEKEKERKGNEKKHDLGNHKIKPAFFLGLVFCILSGVLSAGVNFGFVFGSPISEQAATLGIPDFAQSFAIWSLVFSANYIINALYGIVMMLQKGNIRKLITHSKPGYWLGAVFMGLAWPGGIIVYGIGAEKMGPFGAYVGFPMMLLVSILTGNIAGVLGGEWKGTQVKSRAIMVVGIIIITIAFVLLGYSNKLLS